MSIDALQEKIRKRKSALLLDLTLFPEELPQEYADAYPRYCLALLKGLKGRIPGVRFRFSHFALLGAQTLSQLPTLLKEAKDLGFYVLLDAPEAYSSQQATFTAQTLLHPGGEYYCDGIILPFYAGSDILQPYLSYCEDQKKDVFALARTPNKSAPELQDLLTGTRLVHTAVAARVERFAASTAGKYGYACLGVAAAATAPDSLKALRSKYPGLFLLADGLDYPSGNMKNVSLIFDKLGRGGAYCARQMVSCAWQKGDGSDSIAAAVQEVERQKAGLQRYVTFL